MAKYILLKTVIRLQAWSACEKWLLISLTSGHCQGNQNARYEILRWWVGWEERDAFRREVVSLERYLRELILGGRPSCAPMGVKVKDGQERCLRCPSLTLFHQGYAKSCASSQARPSFSSSQLPLCQVIRWTTLYSSCSLAPGSVHPLKAEAVTFISAFYLPGIY